MKINTKGFTLIELMIGVAIVGILASVAVPSYLSFFRKGNRAEAQGALVTFANAMEQWRLQNGTYLGAAADGADTGSPTIFSTVVPISGQSTTTYNLTISAATATTYTLTATAVGSQAADGNLSLTSTGVKTCSVASSCLNGTSW